MKRRGGTEQETGGAQRSQSEEEEITVNGVEGTMARAAGSRAALFTVRRPTCLILIILIQNHRQEASRAHANG
ncbi:uncharacterized protein V6R79_004807 [Siganus canaliculatus]